ncbi:hypothetical protein [Streptomyces chromofuscus]|uniref:Uncharacterized protein n=1 Tax=Streptomyces chromofuscus TaxID=42881 RepID=A0A7M2TBA4_STRCW|nr:hypothetical protein [Streptomyces chromofuscus]QOV45534.1 hypothetical protein IPT68_06225 [Streptomyces chromofuscus]GGT20068.1 hypothetical protein GCM10010254_45850 [Streptomyces chromofuscus]
MTPTSTTTGRQYRTFAPRYAEALPRDQRPAQASAPAPAPQPLPDPPIYRDLMRTWAHRGRTLPGRHDPEWIRLAAPLVGPGQFSASPDPRDDGR